MRKQSLFGFLAAAVVLIGAFYFLPQHSAPRKLWPEVLLQGVTNRAGTNLAVFRIVNHGPGPVMLWEPARIRTEAGLGPEIRNFTGTALGVGQATTSTLPLPQQSVRWQAGFLYDYSGWRSKVEQWGWVDRSQKWSWSQWIEP
jgi:hypothetical protein